MDDDSDEMYELKSKPKQMVKKKKKPDSLISTTPKPASTAEYEGIIGFQEPDGHFSSLPTLYKDLLDKTLPEDLEIAVKDVSMLSQIWFTILAILILEKHHSDTKDEWSMIAKKARSFLKKNMQKGTDISIYSSYIS
jgi:hypothetical protein